ncbi:MAG: hypothetical protein R3E54_00895 [Halioglobus sp.]
MTGAFGWPLLLVFGGLPLWPRLLQVFARPKPLLPPADYPEGIWPLWFSAHAFRHTRLFTSLFLLAVIADTLLS